MEEDKMFYEEYFRQDIATATEFKIKYLRSLLSDDCIYKLIKL